MKVGQWLKRVPWWRGILGGVTIGVGVAAAATLLDWRFNPAGIFHDEDGTRWSVVWETAVSWFVPVALVASVMVTGWLLWSAGTSRGGRARTGVREHWDRVYGTKDPRKVSWYEPRPERSLALVRGTGLALDAPVLDVGGGASTLVDHLLDEGYTDVTVLDIAGGALEAARRRLGPRAGAVGWIEADVLDFEPGRRYELWHDRAVLHFLTDARRRALYLETLKKALAPGGHVVLATFGPEGPTRCSGLDVRRYSVDRLSALLGADFEAHADSLEMHRTPGGGEQQFLYGWWVRR